MANSSINWSGEGEHIAVVARSLFQYAKVAGQGVGMSQQRVGYRIKKFCGENPKTGKPYGLRELRKGEGPLAEFMNEVLLSPRIMMELMRTARERELMHGQATHTNLTDVPVKKMHEVVDKVVDALRQRGGGTGNGTTKKKYPRLAKTG